MIAGTVVWSTRRGTPTPHDESLTGLSSFRNIAQLRLIDGQLAAVGVMCGDDVEQFAIQLLDITRTDDARVNIVSSGAVGDYSSTFAVADGDYIWASRKCYDKR